MAELALKLFDPEEAGAAQATPAPEPPKAEPGPRVAVELLDGVPLSDLVKLRPNGSRTPEAERRWLQLRAEKLALGNENMAWKGPHGEWYFSHLAELRRPGETVATLCFAATGRPVRNLFGLYIADQVAALLPALTEAERKDFFNKAELLRQYDVHEKTFASRSRPERDRVFTADPERQKFCRERGIKKWSPRSLREWREKVESGTLVPRGRPRLDAEGYDEQCRPEAWVAYRVLYLDPRRRTRRLCWKVVNEEAHEKGWTWLPYHSLLRRVRKELPDFVADFWRLGERRWFAKHAPRIERSYDHLRSNEHWQSDHAQFDFLALVDGKYVRLWITLWIDVHSRFVVAWHIDTRPCGQTILASFRRGVFAHGAPFEATIDNGPDYASKVVSGGAGRIDEEQVRGLFTALAIIVHFCIPFRPGSKGIVERFVGTMHDNFDRLQSTYCGASPDRRPEKLYAELKAGKLAGPTIDEVRELFGAWLEAYHDTPHSALNQQTPRALFGRGMIARRTAPPEMLDVLLLPQADVTIGNRRGLGVRVAGFTYGQDNPAVWHLSSGDKVTARYDPTDRGYVLLYDAAGRFITRAENARLRGVTEADTAEGARRQARARRTVRAAFPLQRERLCSKEDAALHVAYQRRSAERQAAQQRLAVGGEGQADPGPRNIELLPGAAEAAASLAALQRRSPEHRSVASAAERLARLGAFVERPEAARPAFSYARFAEAGFERDQDYWLRELADEPSDGPRPELKESLDDCDFTDDCAPDRPEPEIPVGSVPAELGEPGDEGERGAGYA